MDGATCAVEVWALAHRRGTGSGQKRNGCDGERGAWHTHLPVGPQSGLRS